MLLGIKPVQEEADVDGKCMSSTDYETQLWENVYELSISQTVGT